MWRKFVKPENLFFLGTAQALFPYIIWTIEGPNPNYDYTVTYIPMVLWLTASTCFWMGAKTLNLKNNFIFLREKYVVKNIFNIELKYIKYLLHFFIIIVIIEIFFIIKLFGTIPIVSFFLNQTDIYFIHDVQEQSSFGHLGALLITISLINSLLLILIIRKNNEQKKIGFLTTIYFIIILLFANLVTGKRQSLIQSVFYIFVGLSIYYNDPIKPLIKNINFFKRHYSVSKIQSGSILIIALLLLLSLFTAVGTVRVRGMEEISFDPFVEYITYISFPLINFEGQANIIGYGPHHLDLWPNLKELLPYRLQTEFEDEYIPRLEPTIGSGFIGGYHWCGGFLGVAIYCYFWGLLCKYIYIRAFENFFFFLTYCQISWTLFIAHTHNHFFNLLFIPLPVLVFLVLFVFLRAGGFLKKCK